MLETNCTEQSHALATSRRPKPLARRWLRIKSPRGPKERLSRERPFGRPRFIVGHLIARSFTFANRFIEKKGWQFRGAFPASSFPSSRYNLGMMTLSRVLRPAAPWALVFAMAAGFTSVSAEACQMKNCAHHAEGKGGKDHKKCSCPCGEKHAKSDAKIDAKADFMEHSCSKDKCKEANCTDKGCCQHSGHEHDAS